MVEDLMVEKFLVKNLDCASCAAKIENGLNDLEGVEEAVVDFANLTLHLKAADIASALEEIPKIDPNVEVVPKPDPTVPSVREEAAPGFNLKKELTLLISAAVLFMAHLLFKDTLRNLPWPGVEIMVVLTAYLLAGANVLLKAFRTIRMGTFFDENVLMMIATAGALAIHAYSEAIGVMLFYKAGELLQESAVDRSRRSIKALLAAKPDKARLKTARGFEEIAPEKVLVGETLVVKPGEKIPLDGEILEGTSQIDTSALTGESVPLSVKVGDGVMAGQISKTGALTIQVTRAFEESSIARVMELVENATARKAKTEKFITKFARYYTPAVVLIAAGIAFLPPLMAGASFEKWIYRALVILVISCPCALVVSIPLGYFGGLGAASRRGILVKGSNYLDALAALKTVVFDKTGTLTQGVFKVNTVVNLNGFSKTQILEFAAAAEYQSTHPIATSILEAYQAAGNTLKIDQISDHQDLSGQGVHARYGDHDIMVGNDSLLHLKQIAHEQCEFDTTVVHVGVDGTYAGYITIGDELRPDAPQAMQALRSQGVKQLAMLTGDNRCAAEAVSQKLGLDQTYAELLPEDKVALFEQLERADHQEGKIAYVGDGINDAPVIARADVGVAMGALGSDAAIETADVVLMTDSPLKMAEAVSIAKQTRSVVWQNIILAFTVKGIFIVFGAMGLASMWEAVFADMGTALLAVANATRIIKGRNQVLADGAVHDAV